MSRKTKLRLASLILLLIALIFLFCAVASPTLGHVFYLGPFRIAAEQRQVFYRLYAAVRPLKPHKKARHGRPCRAFSRFSQNSALPTVRGCSSTSRMLLTPVRYITMRSKPRPKPAWRQEP